MTYNQTTLIVNRLQQFNQLAQQIQQLSSEIQQLVHQLPNNPVGIQTGIGMHPSYQSNTYPTPVYSTQTQPTSVIQTGNGYMNRN